MTTSILCPTPTDQTRILQLIDPALTPINRPDMVIIQDGDRVSFTHLSDCEGYDITSEEFMSRHHVIKTVKVIYPLGVIICIGLMFYIIYSYKFNLIEGATSSFYLAHFIMFMLIAIAGTLGIMKYKNRLI